MTWQTSRRSISLNCPLVMAIMNVTPDSFSDGGDLSDVDAALRRAEKLIGEGADILDIGGESTRPGSVRIPAGEEIARVVPVIAEITRRFDIPVSVDTTKSEVAERAIDVGAEIINDISGLRFDEKVAEVAARSGSGLVLMHSRGTFEAMHTQPPVDDIISDVFRDFARGIQKAAASGVHRENIVLDIGIGFGKSIEQNLELLARLDLISREFAEFPILAGTSRKSFIGKILDRARPADRVVGSIATAAIAVWNGASIVRVHDVQPAVDALKTVEAIRNWR
jgi:dihydropteroate synthase